MTKAEKIIANARKNPTKRNVALLAKLAEGLLKSRKNARLAKKKAQSAAAESARRIYQHNYDIETGRKNGSYA